jgi:hypothetical protein
MGLVDLIEKLINERGSAAVMEKRLMLIKEEAAALDKKNGELTRHVEFLEKDNSELRKKLAIFAKAEEFVEFEGAAFKRKSDGAFHHGIYCPIHHLPASSIEAGFPYSCPNNDCGWASHITPRELASVIQKLEPQQSLDAEGTEMLVSIANAPNGVWTEELFAQFRLSLARGQYVLDQLLEHGFVEYVARITPDGSPLQATRKGRDYLAQKGLL